MKYDFDHSPERRHTDCFKWDLFPEDTLPLWVADMDFAVCPKIIEAIEKRMQHPVFGYSLESPELKKVFAERMTERYGWKVEPEDLILVPGIVSGFNFAIRAFCGADLYFDDADGLWKIDFDKFESEIKENTALFILCNPHNPVGRVFTKEELTRLGEICLKHNVKICSDEIHCEIIYDGYHHTPIASLSPEFAANTLTFMAPSKTFNIPGLSCSVAIRTLSTTPRK